MAALTPTSILEKLFKVDPRVARVILIGLAALAAVALVGSWNIDATTILPVVLWLAGGYVLFAFLANMPGWFGSLLGGLATLGFAAYVGLFGVQLVTQNRYNPPLMVAGCYFAPAQQGCPLKVLPPEERGEIVVAASEGGSSRDVPREGTAPGAIVLPDVGAAPAPAAGPSPPAAEPPGVDLSRLRVFVQYFGRTIEEGQAGRLVGRLADAGWPVSPDVEALSSAFGLNEVRYFHAEDEAAARELAQMIPAMVDWVPEMRVRDFTHVSGARPGLLEVWIGG